MKPEIERYLDEHGAKYTPEALRRVLLDAGHEPTEVDVALTEWNARATSRAPAASERRRFWLSALAIHAAVLVLIGILTLAIGSFAQAGWIALVILAAVLLVGTGISGAIGRSFLKGSGLTIALLAPAVSALLIGGSCLAFGGSLVFERPAPPPTTGVVELRLEPPRAFDGSGTATCQVYRDGSGVSVAADDLRSTNGARASASIEVLTPVELPGGTPAVSDGEGVANLFITLLPADPEQRREFANAPGTRIQVEAIPGGFSGSARFERLSRDGAPPSGPSDVISGTLTWRCD